MVLKIRYYGCQWDFIWCNLTIKCSHSHLILMGSMLGLFYISMSEVNLVIGSYPCRCFIFDSLCRTHIRIKQCDSVGIASLR